LLARRLAARDNPVFRSRFDPRRPAVPAHHAPSSAPVAGHSATARLFDRFSKWAARFTGRPMAFTLAVSVVLAWLVTGPLFGYSDTWQLVINTATTVVTFLMVFLIQNTQTRDTEAIQIKLDELISVTAAASNALMDLEDLDEATLASYHQHYERMARKARGLVEERSRRR